MLGMFLVFKDAKQMVDILIRDLNKLFLFKNPLDRSSILDSSENL